MGWQTTGEFKDIVEAVKEYEAYKAQLPTAEVTGVRLIQVVISHKV
jgi:hypothetical protein